MTIIDANVLLYAYEAGTAEQKQASRWLETLLERDETIGLPWITLWAFIRVSTNPRIWKRPHSMKEAFAVVGEWLSQPGVAALNPGPLHASILERLVIEGRVSSPLVTDAVLAALAIEYGAVLASADRDFGRFPELRWINPLEA